MGKAKVEDVSVYRKSNELINAGYMLNMVEQKVIGVLLSRMQAFGDDSRRGEIPEVEISVKELAGAVGTPYTDMVYYIKGIINDLHSKVVHWINEDGTDVWLNWFEYTKLSPDKKNVTFLFNKHLKIHLAGLKGFYTTINLDQYLKMSSKYALRLFEMLWQNRYQKKDGFWDRTFSVTELRWSLQLKHDEYTSFGNLNSRVLQAAVRDINKNLGVEVSTQLLKTGKAVDRVRFIIDARHLEPDQGVVETEKDAQILERYYEDMSPLFKKRFNERLETALRETGEMPGLSERVTREIVRSALLADVMRGVVSLRKSSVV